MLATMAVGYAGELPSSGFPMEPLLQVRPEKGVASHGVEA